MPNVVIVIFCPIFLNFFFSACLCCPLTHKLFCYCILFHCYPLSSLISFCVYCLFTFKFLFLTASQFSQFIPYLLPFLFLFLSTSVLLYNIVFFLAFFTPHCSSFSYCSLFLTTLLFIALGSATHSLIPMTDTLLRGNEEFSSDDELPMSPRVLLQRLHINYWKIYKYP